MSKCETKLQRILNIKWLRSTERFHVRLKFCCFSTHLCITCSHIIWGRWIYLSVTQKADARSPKKYFTKQLQKLGCNHNPSLQESGRNCIGLNAAGDNSVCVINENTCRHLREEVRVDIENITLPPMKKREKDS